MQELANQTSRNIQDQDYISGRTINIDLYRDTAYKGILFEMLGYATPSWSGGAPVADPRGLIGALISRIDIVAGDEVVKSVSPQLLKNLQKLLAGAADPVTYKVNSTSLNGSEVEGETYAFGTTGQPIAMQDSVYMSFENLLSTKPWETFFNASPYNKVTLRIEFRPIGSLDVGGATGFAATHALVLKSTAILDASAADPAKFPTHFRQVSVPHTFKNDLEQRPIDILPATGRLMGTFIEVVKVDDSTQIESAINRDEASKIFVELYKNGNSNEKARVSIAQLMSENRNKFPLTQGLKNWAYVNLLSNSQPESALDTTGLQSLEYRLTARGLSYSGVSYQVRFHNQLIG